MQASWSKGEKASSVASTRHESDQANSEQSHSSKKQSRRRRTSRNIQSKSGCEGRRRAYERNVDVLYAAITRFNVCLLFMIMAFVRILYLEHVDVAAAFLNETTDRDFRILLPYSLPEGRLAGTTYRLHKSWHWLQHTLLLCY